MKKTVGFLALLALPACLGGGGGGADVTRAGIDTVANAEMATALNGARGVGLPGLAYNQTVGEVAQDHAQDMVDRNYLSIFELGSTDGTASDGRRDLGDDLNDAGFTWENIVQMVAQGEKANGQALFDELLALRTSDGVEGDTGLTLEDELEFEPGYNTFGLGKAGSGSNQKWALIVVDPS